MASDADGDAVLSDVEGDDDPAPILIHEPSQEDISQEKFREVLAELDRERKARESAETSKSELQTSFNRLKALAHEAIKKRDESTRQRDEAKEEIAKLKESLIVELSESNRVKESLSVELNESNRVKDELAKELDEISKARDLLKSEFENSAHMLVTGIEKISGKVSNFKNFSAGGLPKSQKYTTGMPAVAYGVIKRTNEIVEELMRQIEATSKSRNEARDQMEQRNYEIAIEVSQLEATISQLRDEVEKKSNHIEKLEKLISEKDATIAGVENAMLELRELAGASDDKLRNLETKMEVQRPLLINQLNMVSKIHDRIYDVIKIVDDKLDNSELSESLFLPQETDMEENMRASLAGMEYIYELIGIVSGKLKDAIEVRDRELKSSNETVTRLVKEKEDIGSLLKSALSKRMASENDELFHVAENGLREAGIEFQFKNVIGAEEGTLGTEEDEIYSLAGALENIVKTSQLQIIELQHSVDELRAESKILKEHVEAQAKELSHRKHQLEELEEKERAANESVEGLMMDIAAAEEEITRWKVAAEQEAGAGKAIEQELLAQLSTIRQELEEAKQAMTESEKKLIFKEETAIAAMAARDAAEKSLKLADLRASRLRDRVEELTRQLEEFDTREDLRRTRNGARYVCWPWQWLGMNYPGLRIMDSQRQSSNEMELAEPLL